MEVPKVLELENQALYISISTKLLLVVLRTPPIEHGLLQY